jgi:hypothetical protein
MADRNKHAMACNTAELITTVKSFVAQASRPKLLHIEHSDRQCLLSLLALPANIRLRWKWLAMVSTLGEH